jgi:uncharacterized protein (DUF2345 family)
MKKIFLAAFIFAWVFQSAAFAEVIVGERTGTLIVTSPDASCVVTVAPGDPLNASTYLDGTLIQVVSGVARISTTGTTTIRVIAGGQTFQLAADTAVQVISEPAGAVVKVTAGPVTTTSASGRTATLNSGDQIRLFPKTGALKVIKGAGK